MLKEATEELLKDLIDETEKADGEEEIEKALEKQKLSAKELNTIRGALRLLTAVKAKIPKDVMQKLSGLTGDKVAKVSEFLKLKLAEKKMTAKEFLSEDLDEIAKQLDIKVENLRKLFDGGTKKMNNKNSIMKEDGSLNLDAVSEEARPVVEAIWKQGSENKEKLAKAEEALNKAKDQIAKDKEEAKKKEWIQKAQEFKDVPDIGDLNELGETMMKLDEVSHERCEKFIAGLRAGKAAIEKSDLFGEIGRPGGIVPGSAVEEVQKLAKSMVIKDAKLTEADAIQKVFEDNPSLYNKYRAETQQRVGKV